MVCCAAANVDISAHLRAFDLDWCEAGLLASKFFHSIFFATFCVYEISVVLNVDVSATIHAGADRIFRSQASEVSYLW